MGLTLDANANAAGARCISTADSAVRLRVLHTNEEAAIAHHTLRVAGLTSTRAPGA
jgi:acetate kinase